MSRPFVDTLITQLDHDVDERVLYEKRLQDHWIPCIVQVSITSRQENFWKLLHHQLLLKTRHTTNPSVRWGALQAVQALYRHWGEEFLILLPETIPFLAELLEDDDVSVELVVKKQLPSLKVILGNRFRNIYIKKEFISSLEREFHGFFFR